jgi:hypothetical protein
MSLYDVIRNMVATEPMERFLISPRHRLVGSTSPSWAASTQQAAVVTLPFESLRVTDAIYIENISGYVGGDAVASASFTINGFVCEIANSSNVGLIPVGQPEFTILAPSGNASAPPVSTFTIAVSSPLITFADLSQLAAAGLITNSQPYNLYMQVAALNGSAAQHQAFYVSMMYRHISGLGDG